jgi:hypothetical protein
MFQAFEVACNQRFFLRACPALELPLSCDSLGFRTKRLRINQTEGAVLEGVRSASTVIVVFQAGFEILR